MTPEGITYAIMRLSDAPNIEALRRVWESLGRDYRANPQIIAHKDTLKKQMEEGNATPETP